MRCAAGDPSLAVADGQNDVQEDRRERQAEAMRDELSLTPCNKESTSIDCRRYLQ